MTKEQLTEAGRTIANGIKAALAVGLKEYVPFKSGSMVLDLEGQVLYLTDERRACKLAANRAEEGLEVYQDPNIVAKVPYTCVYCGSVINVLTHGTFWGLQDGCPMCQTMAFAIEQKPKPADAAESRRMKEIAERVERLKVSRIPVSLRGSK